MGEWLHRRLENYPIPEQFQGLELGEGMVLSRNLRPIFRDRDELSGSAELGPALVDALRQSLYLIVLCSPNAADSKWVNREIEDFKRLRSQDRILALILDGEPNASTRGSNDGSMECFPPALRHPAEPLAADLRPEGDGRERGFLKILAGIAQLDFDLLYRRHERVQRRRRVILGSASAAIILLLGSLSAVAFHQRGIAKEQAERATRAEGEAKRQLAETQRQLERSWLAEGRAWHERARVALGQGDRLGAFIYGGRSVGYRGYGRKDSESAEFEEEFPLLLGGTLTDPNLDRERQEEATKVHELMRGVRPRLLPLWSSEPRPSGEKDTPLGAFEVNFSADGTRLVGRFEDSIRVWEAASGKELFTTPVPGATISGDASRIALVSDLAVSVVDLASSKLIASIEGFVDPKGGANLSHDGTVLAMATPEGSLRLWHVDEDFLLSELPAEAGRFAAFSPDGTYVATISGDNVANVWETLSGQKVFSVSGESRYLSSVAFSPDGNRILVWDANDNSGPMESFTLSGEDGPSIRHNFAITAMAISPDGDRVASGGGFYSGHFTSSDYRGYTMDPTQRIKVTRLSTGEEVVMRFIARSDVRALAFSPDGGLLASSLEREFIHAEKLSDDDTQHRIDIWDTATGDRHFFIHGHQDIVTDLAFSPDGNLLASASEDGTIKVWDTGTGPELSLTGHESFVTCAAFNPDGSILASGSIDDLKLWDTATGKELLTIESSDAIVSIAFSADGRFLARGTGQNPRTEFGSGRYGIELIDLATGREILQCKVNSSFGVAPLAFSPDGRFLLAADQVFDSATGDEIEGQLPFDEKTAETWMDSNKNQEPVTPGGTYRAWFKDRTLFLSTIGDPVPDLAARLRSGMIEFSGTEVLVRSSSALFTNEARSPLARVVDPGLSSGRRAELRMMLCARANSGTSATRLWEQWTRENSRFDEMNPGVRRIYLRALLRFGSELVKNDHPSAHPLLSRIPPLLSRDLLEEPAVSLGLRNLIQLFKGDKWIEPHAAIFERIEELNEDTSKHPNARSLWELLLDPDPNQHPSHRK